MASFRCYDNFDIIATLITTNFHLYLIQLWWQFFQNFVYGDVVYAQTWQVLTLKNCIEPFSYASTAYVVASALVSVQLFCKNLSNLQTFFGQMVYRPPWQKTSRTPMLLWVVSKRGHETKKNVLTEGCQTWCVFRPNIWSLTAVKANCRTKGK